MTGTKQSPLVLLVESELMRATALNNACLQAGMQTIVARDLPTALLMISQHVFDACLISARVLEPGDGWSLAAVCRMIFEEAYIGVIAGERSVLTLQSAINNGVDEIFEPSADVEKIVASAMHQLPVHWDEPKRRMN